MLRINIDTRLLGRRGVRQHTSGKPERPRPIAHGWPRDAILARGVGPLFVVSGEAEACICLTQHPAPVFVRWGLAAGCRGAPVWRNSELTQPTRLHQSGAQAGAAAWAPQQQPTIPGNAELSTARQPQHSTSSVSAACTTYTPPINTPNPTDSYPIVWLALIDADITLKFMRLRSSADRSISCHGPRFPCEGRLPPPGPSQCPPPCPPLSDTTPHGSAAAGQAAGPG